MVKEGSFGWHLLMISGVFGDDAAAGHIHQVRQASEHQAKEDEGLLSAEAEGDHFEQTHCGACKCMQMTGQRLYCRCFMQGEWRRL